MFLNSGARLARYQIAAQIGAGGMGEVDRASDSTLDRTVAIKVLRELFFGNGICLGLIHHKRRRSTHRRSRA